MDDLKIIKKQYGEKMMHLCRELFPSLLETPGLLSELMLKHFEPSRFLYDDLIQNYKTEEFKNYIYSFVDVEKDNTVVNDKSPKELLDEAGYILYECKTEEDIQTFKKYYAPGEGLCTFNGGRLNSCDVFFAVKKNVHDIRREDFSNPKREDEYGTSVISIQFRKGTINTLSIKNRYNNKVNNPDNTFNNNLDYIISGLNYSFARQYNYKFKVQDSNFELPNYVYVNGKFYKYNYEINNIYYCLNNIIIDNFQVIDKYSNEPERYMVLDYFIVDLKEKKIQLYENSRHKDGFIDEFKNIQNIVVLKDKEIGNKTLQIIYDGGKEAIIIINNKNQIIEYHNNFQVVAKNDFMNNTSNLIVVEIPNLTEMGVCCFEYVTNSLINFETPNLIKMGDHCFEFADSLTNFDVPNLKEMGDCCFCNANSLTNFDAPNLIKMGNHCFKFITSLRSFKAPNLKEMGDYCFVFADSLRSFETSNLIKMGEKCFCAINSLPSTNNTSNLETQEGQYMQLKNVERAPINLGDKVIEFIKSVKYKFKKNKTNNKSNGGHSR